MATGSLLLLAFQLTAGSPPPEPPRPVWVRHAASDIVDCMMPLRRQVMDVSLKADCVLDARGGLKDCTLRVDADLSPQQQNAARCMIRTYRFAMSDGSSPLGQPVIVPINLRVTP
jgi:hypothetical protein